MFCGNASRNSGCHLMPVDSSCFVTLCLFVSCVCLWRPPKRTQLMPVTCRPQGPGSVPQCVPSQGAASPLILSSQSQCFQNNSCFPQKQSAPWKDRLETVQICCFSPKVPLSQQALRVPPHDDCEIRCMFATTKCATYLPVRANL